MLAAMLLRTFGSLPQESGFGGVLRKTLGMLLVLLSAIWLIGVASGGRSLLRPLMHLAVIERVMPQTINSQQPQAALPLVNQGNNLAGGQARSPSAAQTPLRQQLLGQERSGAQERAQGASPRPHPEFVRVQSLAELDAILATTTTPVMLDFYADWCVSCKEMEAFTFNDPEVVQRMQQIRLLQVDVTANNVADRALLKRFRLFGPPGIIFFAPGGAERRDVRVVGFQDALRFAATLDRVLQ